jgi:uncharacterized protein YjiS (DUF1127 family)
MRNLYVRVPASAGFSGARREAVGGIAALAKKTASHAWAWLEQCRVRAADRRALGQLTDWELKDIGISRAEAGAEAEKWFWRP